MITHTLIIDNTSTYLKKKKKRWRMKVVHSFKRAIIESISIKF